MKRTVIVHTYRSTDDDLFLSIKYCCYSFYFYVYVLVQQMRNQNKKVPIHLNDRLLFKDFLSFMFLSKCWDIKHSLGYLKKNVLFAQMFYLTIHYSFYLTIVLFYSLCFRTSKKLIRKRIRLQTNN
jgi:hypothetical protein